MNDTAELNLVGDPDEAKKYTQKSNVKAASPKLTRRELKANSRATHRPSKTHLASGSKCPQHDLHHQGGDWTGLESNSCTNQPPSSCTRTSSTHPHTTLKELLAASHTSGSGMRSFRKGSFRSKKVVMKLRDCKRNHEPVLPAVYVSADVSSDDDRPNYAPRVIRRNPQSDMLQFTASELRELNSRATDITSSSDASSTATHREGGWPASFRPGDCYGLDARALKRRRLRHTGRCTSAIGKPDKLLSDSPARAQEGGR